MSDTPGDRRDESTAPVSPDVTPETSIPTPPQTSPDATAETAGGAEAAASATAGIPAPQTPAAPPVPTQVPAGWQGGAPQGQAPRPPYPAAAQGQPYGAPHPQAPAYGQQGRPAYPGQNPGYATGSAFGGAPQNQTQPTQPLTGPVVTDTAQTPKKKSGAGAVVGLIVAAALVGGAAGLGGSYAGAQWWGTSAAAPAAGPSTVTVNDSGEVNQATAVAAKVVPSVVTIQASSGSSGGTGSGVILTEDGYVVTNTHVVTLDGATGSPSVRVTTSDGSVYDADIVGTDPTYDLAVIKLQDAEGLTPIEFADSGKLNVGDETIAVGAPLGLSNTVTTGIVSALNRSIQIASSAAPDSGDAPEDDGQESPFYFDIPGQEEQGQQRATTSISIAVIQTDAAINPGNSGGALVDDEGKLVGVNVAIATASGASASGSGNIGVGFAIPSNVVERITDEIIADGVATHGLLGASVQSAGSLEDASITGAYIAELSEGGAAQGAGLQVGDIVTAFNGVPVTNSTDLTAQVRAAAAGSDATVTFVRDGETQTVDVTLGELVP